MIFVLSKTIHTDFEVDTDEVIDELSPRSSMELEEFGRDLSKSLLDYQREAFLKGFEPSTRGGA